MVSDGISVLHPHKAISCLEVGCWVVIYKYFLCLSVYQYNNSVKLTKFHKYVMPV